MTAPITSFSSQLTTELLTWRNPGGEESLWLDPNTPQQSAWNPLFWGRVVTTEIGCSLLIVVATVETVAYAVLIVMPGEHQWGKKLQSSAFTVYWNFGHLVGNLVRKNLFTNESLARCWLAYKPRLVLSLPVSAMCLSYLVQAVFMAFGISPKIGFLVVISFQLVMVKLGSLKMVFRQEDSAYLMEWMDRYPKLGARLGIEATVWNLGLEVQAFEHLDWRNMYPELVDCFNRKYQEALAQHFPDCWQHLNWRIHAIELDGREQVQDIVKKARAHWKNAGILDGLEQDLEDIQQELHEIRQDFEMQLQAVGLQVQMREQGHQASSEETQAVQQELQAFRGKLQVVMQKLQATVVQGFQTLTAAQQAAHAHPGG